MVVGPINRIRKPPVILEMDYFHIGLDEGSKYYDFANQYKIRTKTRGGIHVTKPVPHNQTLRIPAQTFPQFPSGITIIVPHDKASPGWYWFNQLPLVQLKVLEQDVRDAMRVIEAMSASNVSRLTPEQIKENLEEMMNMFQNSRNKLGASISDARLMAENKIPVGPQQ